jgi:hypothetical protein
MKKGGVSLRSRGVDFVHRGVSHFVLEESFVKDTVGIGYDGMPKA